MKKKDPSAIRTIVDARSTHAHHKSPPVTRPGSAENFAERDLSVKAMQEHLCAETDHDTTDLGAEMDVSNCFYQFELRQMAS